MTHTTPPSHPWRATRCCCRIIYIALSLLLTHTATAHPPLRWDTQQATPKPAHWYIYRGESITLQPRLVDGIHPAAITNTPATLRYREPALEPGQYRELPAENTAPGTWQIHWTPECDSGAQQYDYQLWIGTSPSYNSRITGTLIIRESIGTPPSGTPPPPIAGWATPADLAAATNTLATQLQPQINTTANTLHSHTNDADIHLTPAQSTRIDQAVLGSDIPDYLRALGSPSASVTNWVFEDIGGSHHVEFTPMGLTLHNLSTGSSSHILRGLIRISDFYDTHGAELLPSGLKNLSTGNLYPYPTSPSSPITTHHDLAAATNHLIQTWVLTTNSWLTVSNNVLTVYYIDDTHTTNAIWSSAESSGTPEIPPGIDPSATNLLWQALHTKAPKAWGDLAPDGSINPDPDYMLYINKPATMFASGFEWATHGSYAVLATSGAVAFMGGNSGEVRFGTDLHDNWFGIQAGGSLVIGARTDSISHDHASQTVTMTYDYTGSQPQLYFAPTLAEGLMGFSLQTDGVFWTDNGDGTWTVIAPATTPRGFWYATTTVQIDSYFVTKMPARFDGGIMGGTNNAPVFPNTVIEIQQGSKTYRVLAQEVSP